MPNINNIRHQEMAKFLERLGYTMTINSGHYHFRKQGQLRPITFQTHVNPIPQMVMRTILRNIGMTKEEFIERFSEK